VQSSASDTIDADVIVFGGGISGLTVAHEFAERNFKVAVVEPNFDATKIFLSRPHNENPGLGGVARSQWCFVGNDAFEDDPVQSPIPPRNMVRASSAGRRFGPLELGYRIDAGKVVFDQSEARTLGLPTLLLVMLEVEKSRVFLHIHIRKVEEGTKPNEYRRVKNALSVLLKDVRVAMKDPALDRLRIDPDDIDIEQSGSTDEPDGFVKIDLNVFELPGEHGFRFFPSFYRHVFDLMRRIPATSPTETEDDGSPARRGRDTVFDNLVSVGSVGYVGDAPGPTAKIPRRKLRSAEEARKVVNDLLRETGYSGADLARLTMKVLRYMTTSRARREAEYEDLSWYDFVEGDRFSARGRFLLESTPGTLGGLFGSEADARTQGTILLQCMRDQFGDGAGSDCLLNGPTDEAWFGHWYRYLQSQNVTFHRGALKGFEVVDGAIAPVAFADHEALEPALRLRFKATEHTIEHPRIGKKPFFGIALPLLEAHALSERFRKAAAAAGVRARDFDALFAFPQKTPDKLKKDLRRPYPSGPLRHLSGIQYFFNQDLRFSGSHTLYLDAPSGLTAIAQPQFWLDPRSEVSGFRSVLSVDIAVWAPSSGNPRRVWHAWGKKRREIAEGLWAQIVRGHQGDYPNKWPKLPLPTVYHIDDNLVFEYRDKEQYPILVDDRTPFLVNEKGRFRRRPGGAPHPDEPSGVRIAYDVAADQWVLAGTFMQTRTRINSMEAACESGRHAVNAILRHLDHPGDPCAIWDPEDFEDEALDAARELDDTLFRKGLPHAWDVLEGDRLDAWFPRDTEEPANEEVQTMLDDGSKALLDVAEALIALRAQSDESEPIAAPISVEALVALDQEFRLSLNLSPVDDGDASSNEAVVSAVLTAVAAAARERQAAFLVTGDAVEIVSDARTLAYECRGTPCEVQIEGELRIRKSFKIKRGKVEEICCTRSTGSSLRLRDLPGSARGHCKALNVPYTWVLFFGQPGTDEIFAAVPLDQAAP
jgi:hypothetical protein